MNSGRLEAFSDGVLAIIITIMVLEMKAPEGTSIEALMEIVPIFLSYIISFVYLGSYWNNHHHLFQITERVNGKVLWANLHLLFWLSLIPFATSWIGENHIEALPVAFYGMILLMSAIAFFLLRIEIIKSHTENTVLKEHLQDKKELLSLALYLVGTIASFFMPYLGIICYISVLLIWFIPSSQIEHKLNK